MKVPDYSKKKMNKEDIEYTLKDTNGNKYTIIDTKKVDIQEELNKEINKLIAESTEWESKCYNLKERISKAIEYMENNSKISLDDYVSITNFYKQLLDILKGVDK